MNQLIEEIFSGDDWYKAEIRSRNDNTYEVSIFKWTHELVPDYGEVCPPFWERVSTGSTLADSLSTARSMAEEDLKRLSGNATCKSTWESPAQVQDKYNGVITEAGKEPVQAESIEGIAGMGLLVALLVLFLFLSPVVWWFYGPAWSIVAAIVSVILFGLTPFRDLIRIVLIFNVIYCALAAGYLVFI